MRLAVLGPVELIGEAGPVTVTPRMARHLLTMLALADPAPMSLDALIDSLWNEPPAAAAKTVQGLLSRLRTLLAQAGVPAPAITGGPSGYRLADVGELDVVAMHQQADVGRRALLSGAWSMAIDALRRARASFRGWPELPETLAGTAELARLTEVRIGIEHDHVVALMRAGQFTDAVGELEVLIRQWPLRENLRALLISALAHDGRSAEALQAFADLRRTLVDDLGIEPGDELREIQREVLAGRLPELPSWRSRRAGPTVTPQQSEIDLPTRFVEVDGLHIAYRTMTGQHPAAAHLVLLNPGTLPVDCVLEEPHFANAIAAIAPFADVVWFDRRGIGLSDRCTADRLPSVDDWTRDLEAVLDAVGSESAFLLASEDTTAVALQFAVSRPGRLDGIVLSNAYPRFTRGAGYSFGLDPLLAHTSVTEVTEAEPAADGFDLLNVIAPSMSDDRQFRRWWNDAGRRGASSGVAFALRARHQDDDIRHLLSGVTTPILHLVNPGALAHDRGHDRYLQEHLADITTVELPGRDELWWLDTSGIALAHLEQFLRTDR